jgi:hypothetical protein
MSLHKFAEQVAAQGRGDDSLLVHMTPDEVRNLQKFAEANGTTLTINPTTGLPEAGLLSDLFKAVAPIALGAFLGPGAFGIAGLGLSAGTAGLVTGGLTTLATGSLSRGLMAGLGAYGGAGLAQGFADAGVGAGMSEALAGSSSGNLGQAFGDVASVAGDGSSGQAFNEFLKSSANPATMSGTELATSGFKAAATDPLTFAKNNFGNIAAAAAPIMAGQMVPTTTKMPENTNPAYIRQKLYDPFTQTYKSLTPVKASEFGGRNFSDAYTNPQTGQMATLDQRQPTPMAGGGIVALARGGDVVRMAGGTPPAMLSDEQLYQQTGSWEAAAEARDQQNRAANIYADAQKLMPPAATTAPVSTAAPTYFAANPDVAKAFTENSYGLTPQQFADTHYDKFGKAEMASGQRAPTTQSAGAAYAAAHNIDLQKLIDNAVVNNPFATTADINNALTGSGLTQEDVNPYLTASTVISPAARYALSHASEMPGAGGLAGMQKGILAALARNPNMTQSEIDAAQAQYKISDYDIQSPLIHGYQVASDQEAAAQKYIADNPDVARWISSAEGQAYLKSNPQFDAKDIAYTHYERYGEDEGRKWGEVKKPPPLPQPPITITPGGTLMPGGFVYDNGAISNYGNNTGNPLTRTPGDLINNPNGTVTVVPNIPGRPYGGFPGMESVRNSYTAGGGSLGYTAQAPKTMDEFNQRFNKQTDDSLDAYNFLMGKGKNLTQANAAKNRPLMQPYFTGSNRYKPKFLSYDKDGAITSSATSGATGDAKAVDLTKAKTIEIVDSSGYNTETYTAVLQDDGTYLAGNGKRYDVTGKQVAAGGGMMGYAVGGGLGSLGSYSDGGRLLKGPGDGVSDSIPATIGRNRQPARLADGEFVIPARIVSELGNGSTEAGAKKLYAMMDRVQKARGKTTGKNKVAANSRADKHLPA